MKRIHLLSIAYSQSGHVAVRTGYFGLCAKEDSDGYSWVCASDVADLKVELSGANGDEDPLDAVDMAGRFKSGVVFPGLL